MFFWVIAVVAFMDFLFGKDCLKKCCYVGVGCMGKSEDWGQWECKWGRKIGGWAWKCLNFDG